MIPIHFLPRRRATHRQRGFSLVELSVVLIVIGLVLGAVRESTLANNVVANNPGQIWPIDDRMAFGSTTATSLDESQVAIATAFFKMMR